MKIKQYVINAMILVVVFVLAVLFFSAITNEGNNAMTADMDAPTMPQISFASKEFGVNILSGNKQEMDKTKIRDVITPVYNGVLNMNILAYDNTITQVDYKVYTLDGHEELLNGSKKEIGDTIELDLSKSDVVSQERLLSIILHREKGKEVYFYTRVADAELTFAEQYLSFVHGFSEAAISKDENVDIAVYLEPDQSETNGNYSKVTIHNNYDTVSWGDLAPTTEGKVRYNIMELRANYASIKLEYYVLIGEEDNQDTCKVREFFKVRYDSKKNEYYLLDYQRNTEMLFHIGDAAITGKGIILGLLDSDAQYLVNGDGSAVSFVQAGEVWNYNKTKGELAKVFSFSDRESADLRSNTDKHDIKLLKVDKEGNTTFGIFGYMNRGHHEGKTGALVYQYNMEENTVEEKLFIESNEGYEIVENTLEKLLYYSEKRNKVCVLSEDVLYEVELSKDQRGKHQVVQNLEEGHYAISENKRQIAYEAKGVEKEGDNIIIRNLETGEEQSVASKKGEYVKILGFVNDDFVYGIYKEEDAGDDTFGEWQYAMYKVVIRNSKGKEIKTYEEDNIFVNDALIESNMITLHRIAKENGTYHAIGDDYIINNEETKSSNIYMETYADKSRGMLMRLIFVDGIANKETKLLSPKQVIYDKPITISLKEDEKEKGTKSKDHFYVYGQGGLKGVYDNVGDAINGAEACAGIVTDDVGSYIWERGNRSLTYAMPKPETVISKLKKSDNYQKINIKGTTAEQMLYLVSRDIPVLAVTKEERELVLTGYDMVGIFYTDINSGEKGSATYEELEEITEAYIGAVF